MPIEMRRARPLYREYCVGCCLNGCYPWNKNPLLMCARDKPKEALVPHGTILEEKACDEGVETCIDYTPATDAMWSGYLKGLMEEAVKREEMRLKAATGIEVMSNDEEVWEV